MKSTLEDATLSGVSRVAEYEAQKRASRLEREASTEYKTLEEGIGFIVSLIEPFKLEDSPNE